MMLHHVILDAMFILGWSVMPNIFISLWYRMFNIWLEVSHPPTAKARDLCELSQAPVAPS